MMGNVFGGDSKLSGLARAAASEGAFSKLDERHSTVNPQSPTRARQDLVRMALRDTLRKYGTPSDWIDVRTLSAVTRDQRTGMHVQFLVHKADRQVMNYLHAFQETFWQEIESIDSRARQWLFSVGWEFYGRTDQVADAQSSPASA